MSPFRSITTADPETLALLEKLSTRRGKQFDPTARSTRSAPKRRLPTSPYNSPKQVGQRDPQKLKTLVLAALPSYA